MTGTAALCSSLARQRSLQSLFPGPQSAPAPATSRRRDTTRHAAPRNPALTDTLAVHILTLLHHPSRPISTILIEQYRPPAGATCIELPAGLVDEGEDAV